MEKKYWSINLQDSFNHQMFCSTNNADLPNSYNHSLSGAYLSRKSILEDHEEIVSAKKIPFKLSKSDVIFDNVACEAQKVDLGNKMCKAIHILGITEHGDFWDELELFFEDGTMSLFRFLLKDWRDLRLWDFDEIQGCHVAFEGKDNFNERRFVYQCVIDLGVIKTVKAMKLPYNPNIHLQSITLEVV